jgi:cytochrome c peroxidase
VPDPDLDDEFQMLLNASGVEATTIPVQDAAMVRLGQALFFDKILSGNRDVSCATCHTPLAATADGLSLSVGTGGRGVAQARSAPMDADGEPILIPRNAPDVFRSQLSTMFWDARVVDHGGGEFTSPAGDQLLAGLDSALAVQAMFPVTSRDEMRGQVGENELADLEDDNFHGIWSGLMDRLLAIEEYSQLFAVAFPGTDSKSLTFVHAARAIAAFETDIESLSSSPFDAYVAGDIAALSESAVRGGVLFYDAAGCARCHSGNAFTDEAFHNRAVPQLGPGKGGGIDGSFDFGREHATEDPLDRFKFRTPPLRNVAASGPWMHDGAYTSLEGAVRHCMDPVEGLLAYDSEQLADLVKLTIRPEHDAAILAAVDQTDVQGVQLTEEELQDLLMFLNGLTTRSLGELSLRVTPSSVPSGLAVSD